MLTIMNPTNNRSTDYSRNYLWLEAKRMAKYAEDSDGKLRAWSIRVIEGSGVSLRVDYLTTAGEPKSIHQAI